MSSTSIERGDLVRIKPEWLDPRETGKEKYVVVRDFGDDRVLIQILGTGQPLPSTSTADKSWLIYCGHVTLNY